MPQPPWKHVLTTGLQFAPLLRARQLAAPLIAQAQLAPGRLSTVVDELAETGRSRSEQLRTIVRSEIDRHLSGLGLATKTDLAALESRLGAAKNNALPKKKAATTRNAPGKPEPASTTRRAR